jgi:hypothetical protein
VRKIIDRKIKKIVSGGQTGVDQAALLAASELGIPIGGWCPLGGLDENGKSILDLYPLMQEVKNCSFDESIALHTKWNIRDSDGTLIIVPSLPLPANIRDETKLTIEQAIEQNKPYLILDLSNKPTHIDIIEWINRNHISVLNIAGPRESNCPGIHDVSYILLRKIFEEFTHRYSFGHKAKL